MTEQDIHQAAIAALGLPAEWTITVAIRPRRRTLAVEVQPGGTIVVLVPPGTDPQRVAGYLRGHHTWLATNVRRAVELAPEFAAKRWIDGEQFDLLGACHTLRLTDDGPAARTLRHHSVPGAHLTLQVRRDRPEAMRRAVITLYREQGLAWAQQHGEPYERRGGIQQLQYEVRDLGRHRWGTYNHAKHLVTLHWPLFGLPTELIEYVLAHELAHAARPGGRPHGPAWERQMTRFMPEWRTRRTGLALAGRHAWMGDCHQP